MNHHTPAGNGVRLRLLRRHGKACDAVHDIAVTGGGLAAAMALGEDSPVAIEAARRCLIERHSEGWAFVNGSSTLVCAVNGRRVFAGAICPIAPGDSIEIGLLRFGFEDSEQGRSECDRDAGRSLANGASTFESFRLQDLAPPPFAHGVPLDAPAADLFDVLGLSSEPWHARQGGHIRVDEGTGPDTDSAARLLDALNCEFARVVRDPNQLAGPTEWPEPMAPDRVDAPNAAQLSEESRAYSRIGDILEPHEDVEAVIGRLGPTGEDELFMDAPNGDVLELFAPELSPGPARAIPRLTRREHHAVSLDSHLQLGEAHPGLPTSATDGDERE